MNDGCYSTLHCRAIYSWIRRHSAILFNSKYIEGASSDDNYRVLFCVTRLQHEHRFMNFNHPKREWAKWVSKLVNGASERNKRSEAERCGASERSERCEWAEWAVRANECSERPSGPFKTSQVETGPNLFIVKQLCLHARVQRINQIYHQISHSPFKFFMQLIWILT